MDLILEAQRHSSQKSMVLQITMDKEDLPLEDLEVKRVPFLPCFLHSMDHHLCLVITGALLRLIMVFREECHHLSLKIIGSLTWNKGNSQIPSITR